MTVGGVKINGTAIVAPQIRTLKLNGSVGFDSLAHQLVNKSIQKGFEFNILCIGETGIGKSTLMNTLFNTNFEAAPSPHTVENVKLKASTYQLQEKSVRLNLTICETIGYGDQINKENSYRAVVDYIDTQFETYLKEELKIERSLDAQHDTRVHACLYFICPTGHGLKSIDLDCMKQLESKTNIIPIIAKADSISKQELEQFRAKINEELIKNDVKLYQFPTDDETIAQQINSDKNAHIPFAVVGSNDFVAIAGKQMRVRQYPWGTVQVDNENHCDFVKLREMLVRINMTDLCEVTHFQHYELYRQKRLLEMGFSDVDSNNKPISFQQIFKSKHSKHMATMLTKEEDMRQMIVQRVKEKEAELKAYEKEMYDKFDALKHEHIEEKAKFEESLKALEEECLELKKRKQQFANVQNGMTTLGRSKKK